MGNRCNEHRFPVERRRTRGEPSVDSRRSHTVLPQAHFPLFLDEEPGRLTGLQSDHWTIAVDYLAVRFPLLRKLEVSRY